MSKKGKRERGTCRAKWTRCSMILSGLAGRRHRRGVDTVVVIVITNSGLSSISSGLKKQSMHHSVQKRTPPTSSILGNLIKISLKSRNGAPNLCRHILIDNHTRPTYASSFLELPRRPPRPTRASRPRSGASRGTVPCAPPYRRTSTPAPSRQCQYCGSV